jgi:hypothetical protein
MDEEPKTGSTSQPVRTPPVTSSPATPPQPMKKKGGKKKGLAFLLVIAAIGVGIFLIVKGSGDSKTETSPTPDSNLYDFATPDSTSTPEPVDREDVSIEVLNGTGIAREASYLQGKLADLGYTDIELGNADEQDNETTQVTFSSSTPDEVIDEITEELEGLYEDVETSTSRSQEDVDVQIITGLKKGQTPKPESTETPEASPTESPTPTPTPSPTGE